jgi:hypothetical protein
VSLTGTAPPETEPGVARAGRRPPAIEAEPDREAEAPRERPGGFRADMKLPFATAQVTSTSTALPSIPFAPVPQLVLGGQAGRFGFGAGFGLARVGVSSGSSDLTELLFAPTLSYDVFQSRDAKVACYLLGAPLFGVVLVSHQTTQSDLGFQFALGANYAFHDNFRLGLEVGPIGHFYSSGNFSTSFNTLGLYTALVGTFATH